MQSVIAGQEGFEKPETLFANGLPVRIRQLREDFSREHSADCHCEAFARLRRIFDLAWLLGAAEICQYEDALQQALEHYRTTSCLEPVLALLNTLQHQPYTPLALTEPRWIPHHDPAPGNRSGHYHIHLAATCQHPDYLEHRFSLKHDRITFHNHPADIVPALDTPGRHIVVLDEALCTRHHINSFDFIRANKRESCTFIVLAQTIDFDKRLSAARNDAMLVPTARSDDGILIQAIEKCIATDNILHNRVLLVSHDDALTACLRNILIASNIQTDSIATPSETLLKQLVEGGYDLLLIDYYLDGMYGHELTKIIQQDNLLAHIPIVYLGHQIDMECGTHADFLKSDCRVIDCYDDTIISKTVINTIAQSSGNRRIGRFMAETVRDNENYHRAIDAHSIVSIADPSGRITEVNQKFCEVSGYSRDELIGKNHSIVNSGTHPKKLFIDMWQTIASGKIWHGEICNRKKNGELYWVESTIIPFLDDHGKPYQYVSVRTEITRLKQIETKLRTSENRLMRSQSFANIGTWDWNIVDGSLYWSPRIPPLFGYAEGELDTTYENFLNAVHPDDRQSVMDAVNDCVYKNKDYKIEHRSIWPDGTVRWMLERGDVVRDTQGNPLHMLGVVMDITDLKVTEQENIHQRRLLDILRIGLSWYIEEHDISHVANFMLENLLLLTESKFGIIGGIHFDEANNPYLKSHSVSNIAWDKDSLEFYQTHYKNGLEFHNLDNLIGAVIKTGKPVISNDPAHDTRRGGLPPGHPPLNSYLGVPVYHGEKLVAMFCLANRIGGYDERIIEFLRPFNVTYSAIMQSARLEKVQHDTLAELQRSRKEAIDASLAKSQFLSSMSHELRTPLNAILGFGQLLEMNLEKNLSITQQDNIKEILKAGSHLLELINQVLDLAKIESGKIELSIEPVTVVPILVDCVETIAPLAEKNNISIHWCFNNSTIKPDQINEHEPGMLRISVKDTGKGISREKQARLFKAFDRLGEEGGDIEGTGIGLVITQNIAERMQGRIGFVSTEDVGSEFWLDLPGSRESEISANILAASHDMIRTHEQRALPTKKIIYVEDNPANLRLVESILHAIEGIELITAQESYLGHELIKLHTPDLIMLDINMPGMNGFELLEMLKQSPATRNIPVIAISANAMQTDVEKGLKAGFIEYITKPIVVSNLLETINACLVEAAPRT